MTISNNCVLHRRKPLSLIEKIIINRGLYIVRLLICTLLIGRSNILIDAISEAPFSGFFSFAGLRIRDVFFVDDGLQRHLDGAPIFFLQKGCMEGGRRGCSMSTNSPPMEQA